MYHLSVGSLVVSKNGLDLLSDHEDWLFPSDTRILAVLVIDISEGYVRRVVLDQPQTWATRNCRREVEAKISFLCFSLAG